MSRKLIQSDDFVQDIDLQVDWYLEHANEEVSRRFFAAVRRSVERLLARPDAGRPRRFRHPKLRELRSNLVMRPFHRFVIFYRYDAETLSCERLIHGMRDLPRRLVDTPGAQ